MYYIAEVDKDICASKNCHLCTQYCPESNCINYSEEDKSAYVSVDRCKACEICVYICSDIAKNDAIKMKWIDDLNEGFVIKKSGVVLRYIFLVTKKRYLSSPAQIPFFVQYK